MAWTGLTGHLSFGKRSDPAPLPSPERVRATIERNELLGGEREAVEAILEDGRLERHGEGDRLITEGDQDDDVFFIVSGSVRVLVGTQHCDTREAPQVVGEMAAGRPGSSRTANVIVNRGGATVLRIRGDVFHSALRTSPGIEGRYKGRYEEVARKSMKLISSSPKASGPPWWMISSGVGLASSMTAFGLGLGYSWSWADIAVVTPGSGVIAFVLMMFMDVPRLLLSLCLAAGFTVVYFDATSVLPEGSLVISPEWAPGITVDITFGRKLSLAEQLVWLFFSIAVFFGAWWMYRETTADSSK